MKSIRLLQYVGVLVALNLVACAHEIPLEGGDLTEQESAEEQVADNNQLWQSEGELVAASTAAEGETAQLDAAQTALESEFDSASAAPVPVAAVAQTIDTESAPKVEAPAAPASESLAVRVRQVAKRDVPQEAVAKVEVSVKGSPAPSVEQPKRDEKNRYYVARTGDSAEYVSVLIYKTSDYAAKLLAWNGPSSTWTPGKVLYYVSPEKPEDTKVVSFYEERGLAYDSMTVQPGDTLAGLAEKHLGNSLSSKEIALVNGLKEEEPLKPGQVLKIYPSPLLGKTRAETMVAQVPPISDQKPAAAVVDSRVAASNINDRQAAPTAMEKSDSVKGPAIITLAPAPVADKPKASLASTVMSTLFNHHPLVLACVFAILALFGGFYYMHRRRGSHYDF